MLLSLFLKVFLNPIAVTEFRRMIEDSEIVSEDDALWPDADKGGRQADPSQLLVSFSLFLIRKFSKTNYSLQFDSFNRMFIVFLIGWYLFI